MCKPNNINKIYRHLGEYTVVDYACYGATGLPCGNLELYYDRCDKKVYVHQGGTVFGSLKMSDMQQTFIFAILSSNMNLIECSRVPSDENAPLEQKFHVSLWMRELPPICMPKDTFIRAKAKKDCADSSVDIRIYRDKVTDEKGCIIECDEACKYSLERIEPPISAQIEDGSLNDLMNCGCCSISRIQNMLGLLKDCGCVEGDKKVKIIIK